MQEASYFPLIYNVALLLAMAFLYDVVTVRSRPLTPLRKLLVGATVGLIGIVLLLTPWKLETGIIFDTRSILLGVSGLFFGAVPTLVAMLMTAACRYWLDGTAMATGISVIFSSGLIGILWRRFRQNSLETLSWRELYLFGVIIHLVMLALMLLMPWETALRVLRNITLPVLAIYPAGTMVLGLLMVNRLRRERVTTALEENEARQKAMIAHISDVIAIVDAAGIVRYQSPNITPWFGWRPEERAGASCWDTVHPGDLDRMKQVFADFAQTAPGAVRTVEYHYLCRDGRIRLVELTASNLIHDPSIRGILINYHDITERREAETQLRASMAETQRLLEAAEESRRTLLAMVEEQKRADEALLHERNLLYALMDNLPDRVYFKDADSRFTKISRAHATSMGLSDPAEAIGKTDADFKPPEVAAQALAEERRIIATGQPVIAKVEQRLLDNGKTQWTSAAKVPIKDKQGHVTGLVGISRDITQEIELQQQLQQASKMDAIGRLAGGVAHDFNNLLQVILGSTEILLTHPEVPAAFRDDLLEILKAGQRANSLTRQLLAFGRKQMIEPRVIDLNPHVAGMEKMLHRLLGEDIQIVMNLAPDLKRTFADPGQLEQIIMNLSVNARDAMPGGGRLTLSTTNVTLQDNDVATNPEARAGHFICLSVADTGVGMSPDVLEHVFEPFFTTKGTGKGTGLGLSVIYGIVKQNTGWISVSSRIGQGTTFQVYLPAYRSGWDEPLENMPENGKSLAPELRGRGERILFVEDEDGVRVLATRALQAAGYEILACASVHEAWTMFEAEKGRFHLLFSDVVLPDGNGIELADRILGKKPALPVLLCSGYADERARWSAIEKRRYRFLQKPYTIADLQRSVRDVLDGNAPRPPPPA